MGARSPRAIAHRVMLLVDPGIVRCRPPRHRSLHLTHPNEDLAEVLDRAHQVMPQFRELDAATVLDLATYLRSIDQQ